MIDFATINEKALENLDDVLDWLGLDTKPVGKEIQFINPKRNDSDFGSASINTETGVWADFAEDEAKGGDFVSLVAYIHDCSQSVAAERLETFLAQSDNQPNHGAAATPVVQVVRNNAAAVAAESMLSLVPDDAPGIPASFGKLGRPSRVFTYRSAEGRILGHILRFDTENGKTIRPLTLWRTPVGDMKWKLKGFCTPHPLYRLDELTRYPNATVLVVEGEKAADAAITLFPDWVVTTAMHGAQSVGKADLAPLYGRNVAIWPDNDPAGEKYAQEIAEILVKVDPPAAVSIMQTLDVSPGRNDVGDPVLLPGFEPDKGWDAADAVEMGWTAAHMKLLQVSVFVSVPVPGRVVRVGNFLVNDEGVYKIKLVEGEEQLIKLSSRIDVIALTRNVLSSEWGLVLNFKDRDSHPHEWAMPREMLSGRVEEYRRELLRLGADLSPKGQVDYLTTYLMESNPEARALSVNSTGWHGNVYVLPEQTFGESNERVILQTAEAVRSSSYGTAGSLEDWQREVAMLCAGNTRLVLAVCVSLAGQLLLPLGEDNGGFHFRGASSSGKTKTLSVAASVWGGKDMVRVWRTTGNAIESLAIEHNDSALFLDELGQVSPQDAGDIAYTLANGQQKARANRNGNVRSIARWRLLFMSTGEIGLAEHVASAGGVIRAGQEVRMLDIPADGGAGMGMFQNIHGAANPAVFSDVLQEKSESYYGTAAEALLNRLTASPEERDVAVEIVRERQKWFVDNYVPADSHGQVFRAAGRFGLVAGVGEYCIQIGILPWEPGEAMAGVCECFHAWLESRGGNVASEELRALAQVREFLEHHGESRFTLLAPEGIEDNIGHGTINRAGFRKVLDDGSIEYWVLPEAYKSDVCRGFDPKLVTRMLKAKGFLQIDKDGKAQVANRIPGTQGTKETTRVYVIKPEIFLAEETSEQLVA